MPYNTFSVGSDCQVVVMGPFGRVDLAHVTGFEAQQLTVAVRVDRMDGVQLGAELPKGWAGSFSLDRGSSAVDDFIAQIEAAYLAGQSINAGTLYQYIHEPDGSVSTYQFNGQTIPRHIWSRIIGRYNHSLLHPEQVSKSPR